MRTAKYTGIFHLNLLNGFSPYYLHVIFLILNHWPGVSAGGQNCPRGYRKPSRPCPLIPFPNYQLMSSVLHTLNVLVVWSPPQPSLTIPYSQDVAVVWSIEYTGVQLSIEKRVLDEFVSMVLDECPWFLTIVHGSWRSSSVEGGFLGNFGIFCRKCVWKKYSFAVYVDNKDVQILLRNLELDFIKKMYIEWRNLDYTI